MEFTIIKKITLKAKFQFVSIQNTKPENIWFTLWNCKICPIYSTKTFDSFHCLHFFEFIIVNCFKLVYNIVLYLQRQNGLQINITENATWKVMIWSCFSHWIGLIFLVYCSKQSSKVYMYTVQLPGIILPQMN